MITIEYQELRDTCSCGLKWFPVVEVFRNGLIDDPANRARDRYFHIKDIDTIRFIRIMAWNQQ